MRVTRACEALAKGCCLELYYQRDSFIVEPHAIGFDKQGRSWLLGFERHGGADEESGAWTFLSLEDTRKVAVSGYFSRAPREGYCRDDPRFERILAQL